MLIPATRVSNANFCDILSVRKKISVFAKFLAQTCQFLRHMLATYRTRKLTALPAQNRNVNSCNTDNLSFQSVISAKIKSVRDSVYVPRPHKGVYEGVSGTATRKQAHYCCCSSFTPLSRDYIPRVQYSKPYYLLCCCPSIALCCPPPPIHLHFTAIQVLCIEAFCTA